MRRSSFLSLAILLAAWAGDARGGFITSFEGSIRPTTPAAGWSYLWNSGGAIGNPANYSALVATTDPTYYYDVTGGNSLPGPDPGAYLFFGGVGAGKFGGHPGRGSGQVGIERFAIAAYTLSVGGSISISNSLLSNVNASQNGLDLRIYVDGNSTPLFVGSTAPGAGSVLDFDTNLGVLKTGDTIYVAIGSGVSDINDTFSLQYSLITSNAVPEPASLAMLATGMAGLLGRTMRRRRASLAWIGSRSRSA